MPFNMRSSADWYELCHFNKRGQIVHRWRFSSRGEAGRLFDALRVSHRSWRLKIVECREVRMA